VSTLPDILTPPEAAKKLRVSTRTLMKMVRAREIDFFTVDKQPRFTAEHILKAIARQEASKLTIQGTPALDPLIEFIWPQMERLLVELVRRGRVQIL